MKRDEVRVRNKALDDINNEALARQVLENSAYQRAITEIKGDVYKRFTETPAESYEALSELKREAQVIQDFESKLALAMSSGLYARETLSLLDRAKKVVGI